MEVKKIIQTSEHLKEKKKQEAKNSKLKGWDNVKMCGLGKGYIHKKKW